MTFQLDERKVEQLHLIQSAPELGWLPGVPRRPLLHSYRYALSGDPNVPLLSIVVFDVEMRTACRLRVPPMVLWAPIRTQPTASFFSFEFVVWSADSKTVFLKDISRDHRTLRLWSADAASGAAKLLIEESEPTWVDNWTPMKLLPKRKQIVWWSERSGWGHLYLYSESGALMKALTSGDWLARSVHHVDEDRGVVYFSASGRAPARDPYLRKLYSVAMDTGTVSQLTPEDCDHQVLSGSPSGAILLTIVPLSTNLP